MSDFSRKWGCSGATEEVIGIFACETIMPFCREAVMSDVSSRAARARSMDLRISRSQLKPWRRLPSCFTSLSAQFLAVGPWLLACQMDSRL